MIIRKVWPLALLATATVNAATLPLRAGTYVLAGTPCQEPPFAATFDYDGHAFSYPHATHCRSVVRSRSGHTYEISETCSALGDGTPTEPVTMAASYTVVSKTLVRIRHAPERNLTFYRWCPPPSAKAAASGPGGH